MGKRFGGFCSSFILIFILLFWATGSAGAICGAQPQAPPEGFAWPVAGALTNGWAYDCLADRGHRGIDIATSAGGQIAAAAGGQVSFVGYTPAEGGGLTVTIDHPGGLRSTYLHLMSTSVAAGQPVTSGAPIGVSDGRPLHFGIKTPGGSHDLYFDPLSLLPPLPVAVDATIQATEPVTVMESPAQEIAPVVTSPVPIAPQTATTPRPAAITESPVSAPQSLSPVTPEPVAAVPQTSSAVLLPGEVVSEETIPAAATEAATFTAPAQTSTAASAASSSISMAAPLGASLAPPSMQELWPDEGDETSESGQPAATGLNPWPHQAGASLGSPSFAAQMVSMNRPLTMPAPSRSAHRLAAAAGLLLVSVIGAAVMPLVVRPLRKGRREGGGSNRATEPISV